VCWKPCPSCWSFHLLREEFLSAPIHSPPPLWFAVSVLHKRVTVNVWDADFDPVDVRSRSGWDEWHPAIIRPRLLQKQGPPPTSMHKVEFFKERYPSIKTTVTCDVGVVAEYNNEIKGSPSPKCLLVGLDTEWIELLSASTRSHCCNCASGRITLFTRCAMLATSFLMS
jgi:hypothetical protein